MSREGRWIIATKNTTRIGNSFNRSSLVCLFFYTTPVSLNLVLIHVGQEHCCHSIELNAPVYVSYPTTKAVVKTTQVLHELLSR